MANILATITWIPSVSTDVISQRLDIFVDGIFTNSLELPRNATNAQIEFPEKSLARIEATAFDGKFRSNPAVVESMVPDVTPPEPITGLAMTFPTV